MKKMIEIKEDGTWTCCGVAPSEIDSRIYGALWKLKDYEATEFSPDEVERMKYLCADLAQKARKENGDE